ALQLPDADIQQGATPGPSTIRSRRGRARKAAAGSREAGNRSGHRGAAAAGVAQAEAGMKLFSEEALAEIRRSQAEWEERELAAALRGKPEELSEYQAECGIPLKRIYTAADVADIPAAELGFPGAYPFTRGAYPTMYRGRPWTIRQVAGFGNP